MLRTIVESFRPDVLLVDHMPHGAMGELLPTLEMLRDEPTRVVLGLRDILDAPAVVRERWRLEGAFEAVERYYDQVLVYGSSDVFDIGDEYSWPSAARSKVQYCGYVCAPPPAEVSESVRGRYVHPESDERLVVAMGGGGADAFPIYDALLAAVPDIQRSAPCRFAVVTGPFLPAEQHAELAARAQGLPVEILTSVPDGVAHAAAADLVISMAGYNTTAEILSVGTPALLVPRSGPSAEQQMRARLFAERGWVDWLSPQDLSAETLGAAVVTSLNRPWASTDVRPPDLSGRTVGIGLLIDSMTETRSLAPVVARRAQAELAPVGGVPDDESLSA